MDHIDPDDDFSVSHNPEDLFTLSEEARIYLRPQAFVDGPPDDPRGLMQLAGGWQYFSKIHLMARLDGKILISLRLSVDEVQVTLDRLPPLLKDMAGRQLEMLTNKRSPIAVGEQILRFDRPHVMGIMNITPDSFSDGGRYFKDSQSAAQAVMTMLRSGAALVDIGAESTRPGAKAIWEGEEIDRLRPLFAALQGNDLPLSIDSRKAAVMDFAIKNGARLVNDVSGLTYEPESLEVVVRESLPLVLMHAQGDPEVMQKTPHYQDVLLDIYDWLEQRMRNITKQGIDPRRIILDPGIGFGKTVRHNLRLLNGLALFHSLGCPLLLGASRKSFISNACGKANVEDRLGGSMAALIKGLEQGVQVFRVHDVHESVQAMRLFEALRAESITAVF